MRVQTTADLGALIRDQRRALGLDQRTLAERAGVSRYWVMDIESGKPRAEIGLVLRTLRALGLTVDVHRQTPAPDAKRTDGPRRADTLIKAALERKR